MQVVEGAERLVRVELGAERLPAAVQQVHQFRADLADIERLHQQPIGSALAVAAVTRPPRPSRLPAKELRSIYIFHDTPRYDPIWYMYPELGCFEPSSLTSHDPPVARSR